MLKGTGLQAAEKLSYLHFGGTGGFSPLKTANGFKGL
jgi:hypothetical protein